MTITFVKGDITNFSKGIVINPVNCNESPKNQTAIRLSRLYPENQNRFDEMCELGKISPDKPHIVRLDSGNCIINVSDRKIEDLGKVMKTIFRNFEKISEYCGDDIPAAGIEIPEFTNIKWDLVRNKMTEIFGTPVGEADVYLYGKPKRVKFDLTSQQDDILDFAASGGNPLKISTLQFMGISRDENKKWRNYAVEFDRVIDPKLLKQFIKSNLNLSAGKRHISSPSGSGTSFKRKPGKGDFIRGSSSDFKKFAPVDADGNPIEEKKEKTNKKIGLSAPKVKALKDNPKKLEIKIDRRMMKNKDIGNVEVAKSVRLFVSDFNRGRFSLNK